MSFSLLIISIISNDDSIFTNYHKRIDLPVNPSSSTPTTFFAINMLIFIFTKNKLLESLSYILDFLTKKFYFLNFSRILIKIYCQINTDEEDILRHYYIKKKIFF